MKPHDLAPHLVFASDPPPFRDALYPNRPGGQHFVGTSVAELLAEPSVKSAAWLSAVYARLVVASSGPVAVVGPGAAADRLERARWLRIAPDADAAAARRGSWPAHATCQRLGVGVGSLAPALVVVAERDPYERLPMFARSGVWLFRALRGLGYDELTIYVTNALDADSRAQTGALTQLHEAFAPYDPAWLSLGAIAHEALNGCGIEHVAADHPSHARRFEFAAGPAGYAAKLTAAGLPPGPGAVAPVVEGPSVLVERLGLPKTTSVNPGVGTKAPTVPTPILDAARMKFVLGEALTVKLAAAAVSTDRKERSAIVKLARTQGWELEREAYFAKKREAAKASATAAEAARIGESRALAWEVTQKMLAKINIDLADPTVKVYAKDAKAMNEIALALSEKGDAAFDDERKRLAALAPDAFAAELRKTMDGFGIVSEPAADAPKP